MSQKKVTVTIRNGKIIAEASGYKGVGCEAPMNAIKEALGGTVSKEEATEEAFEHEECATVESGSELLA